MQLFYRRRRFFLGAMVVISALLIASLLVSRLIDIARAATPAPGGPGSTSTWAPSNKTFLGTSATADSNVWFTGYNGIISEVFYPSADIPNTTDLQFLIGDASSPPTWVDEEKVDTRSQTRLYDSHSLAWSVTNTAKNGKYRLDKIIYTDPARSSLLEKVTFTALIGQLANYQLYVLYNPAIHDAGDNNISTTETFSGKTMLVTVDGSGNYASALAASIPYQACKTSSGFVAVNDGWTDLKGANNCGSASCPDFTMNYTYDSAAHGNTAQTGLLDLSRAGSGATSITFNLVLAFGQNNGTDAKANAEQTLSTTLGDTSDMLSTYVSQWNTFDNGLTPPPAAASAANKQEYYLAANVLKAAQDKQSGTFVAGLGTPWGESKNDGDDGYHLTWERDMYEFASALLLTGDTADPKRAINWAFDKQQQADGHFPQETRTDGKMLPNFSGIQMDEQAFPLLLAWKLGVTDNATYTHHIKPAADYIVIHGPKTGQERWEENAGYSPSTIAAEIAGLIAAADIARINGDTTSQARYTSYADYYQAMIQNWTFTTHGTIGGKYYFERIDGNANPDDKDSFDLHNRGDSTVNCPDPCYEYSIVDAGFLELVRQGVMPADSPYITLSLPVIDSTIKRTINNNDYWYRYNYDGYGEHANGSDFDGSGIGRLWPILSGERGIYTIAAGGDASRYLAAMTAAENGSGMIPEQIGDRDSGPFKAGTPTKSMDPLDWAMGEFITLLVSADQNKIADVASIVFDRYVTNAYKPHAGNVTDYAPNQLFQGKALTIFYKNRDALSGASKVYLHWGENGWANVAPDKPMVKRADGFWQATVSVPVDATQINFAFTDGAGNWDTNGGGNWNVAIAAGSLPTALSTPVMSFPYVPVQGQQVKIIYKGTLAAGATRLTLHWGFNNWNGVSDVSMTKQADGSWLGSANLPSTASQLNMAFVDNTGTWDNNGNQNYNLDVSER